MYAKKTVKTEIIKAGFAQWYRYSIVPEDFFHPDIGVYRTYGIQIDTDESTETIHDISTCEKTVKGMVMKMNRGVLSPVHVYDVIMDFLP